MNMEKSARVQLDLLKAYYADNAKKLHRVVDKMLLKFGGLSEKDRDDFYSLANEVFVDVMRRYDETQSFDGFLYSCLSNKIMSEITRRNREKRRADRMCTSLDAVNDNGEEFSLMDVIPSDFDTFEEVMKEQENGQYKDKIQEYISRLSKRQVNILNLMIDGFKPCEIKRMLSISSREYSDSMEAIRSYENVKVLY